MFGVWWFGSVVKNTRRIILIYEMYTLQYSEHRIFPADMSTVVLDAIAVRL